MSVSNRIEIKSFLIKMVLINFNVKIDKKLRNQTRIEEVREKERGIFVVRVSSH